MSQQASQILDRIDKLKTYRRGNRRAPHKPLLLLVALSRLQGGETTLAYPTIEKQLRPLLDVYAPPVSKKHQPELPYWYLQSDGLWLVDRADDLPRQMGGFPTASALRDSCAGFPDEVASAFLNEDGLVNQVVLKILDEHFPQSMHSDIAAAVGFKFVIDGNQIAEPSALERSKSSRRRDPQFRARVLRAYEHRCAVTGFRAALGGSYFGCEAGHVMWHAYGGPDVVQNGISMEPTIHKLFDAGAWTLTDDHRVLVSAEFTGSDSAIQRLRAHHGKPIRIPIVGELPVSGQFIRWHRDPRLGGVFRTPALAL